MSTPGRALLGISFVLLYGASVLIATVAFDDPGILVVFLIFVPFIVALVGIPVWLLAKGVGKLVDRPGGSGGLER